MSSIAARAFRDGFANTPCGRIHYIEKGSGPVLLLLHSVGCSAYEYADVWERLSERFRVLVWDMPGHGDSDPLTGHWTIDAYAQALIELMDALNIETAHLAGTSIGALILAAVAAKHPERIASASLVETPARTFDEWGSIWWTVEETFAIASQTVERVASRVRHVSPLMLARWNIDRSKAGGKTMMDAMWAVRCYEIPPSLASCTAPLQLVYGEKGPVVEHASRLRAMLPQAHSVIMPDCGHFPMLDDPEAFMSVIVHFIGTTPG